MSPCLSCGACCAAFPVVFPRSYVGTGGVPRAWVEPGPHPTQVRLRGTGGETPRCAALAGQIGGARCTVYADRPGVCRSFEPAWLGGVPNPYCDQARARHGLPPLAPDWPTREPIG